MPTGHDHGEGNKECGEGSDPDPVNQGVGDSQAGEEQHPENEVHPHQPSIAFLRRGVIDLRETVADLDQVEPLLRWLIEYSETDADG